jgi:hypothetical protein
MSVKEKTCHPIKSHETKRLFPEMKATDKTAIDRKICALLIAEGYSVIDTQRIKGGNNTNVNEMEYLRGERERVFLITHEPVQGA